MKTYSELRREEMQYEMRRTEREWKPLNRSHRRDPVFFWGSWVIGVLALALLGIETGIQIWMRWHR